ncbi:spore germination protein GerPE [Halobacillus rhizosphaerae]|uniref:spore germination protein GerPE n=1 Tax=Halobacillus rhizosphaerae TaxID=3064889 RepID=UPI00398B08F3
MNNRMVYVEFIDVLSTIIASGFLIGDLYRFAPSAKVLAVQKEGPSLIKDEADFKNYSLFSRLPTPPLRSVNVETFQYNNAPIQVDELFVIGVSTTSLMQIGGIEHIDSKARVKHFRILQEDEQ